MGLGRWHNSAVAIEHEMVDFETGDAHVVVKRLALMLEGRNGDEWLTLSPWIAPHERPVTSVLRRLMSARGPKIPEVSVVPAHGSDPTQVGVMHGCGTGAMQRVASAGVQLGEGWVPTQDHTRRGMLFRLPDSASASAIVTFACRVGAELSMVPIDDRWVARFSNAGD